MKPLAVLDALGFIFRAYYALPPLTNAQGEAIGALLGFMSMVLKWRMKNQDVCLCVAFDSQGQTFRHQLFPEYKAKRIQAPEDLISQIHLVRTFCQILNLPILETPGYEADDLMASVAHQGAAHGWDITLISSDKDLGQCVKPHVCLYDPIKDLDRREKEVEEIWGVRPDQIAYVQALAGDASDNIPGIPGIGPKTAALWIQTFGDLESVLQAGKALGSQKKQELVAQYQEQARLCYALALLNRDLPVDFRSFVMQEPDWNAFEDFCQTHGLHQMNTRYLALKPRAAVEMSALAPQECLQAIQEAGKVSLLFHEETLWSCWGENQVAPLSRQDGQKLLQDDACLTIVFDAKAWMHLGPLRAFEDLELMAYDAGLGAGLSLAQLYTHKLGLAWPTTIQEQVYGLWVLFPLIHKDLVVSKTYALYQTLDKPILHVLHDMEKRGICVHQEELGDLEVSFSKELTLLEEKIYAHVGEHFLISSPQQLGRILFEKLKWDGGKKTKSGGFQTHVLVLEHAAQRGEVLAQWLLSWRQLSTLCNTYTKGLARHIDAQTHRLSTTYTLTKTATGRLSSVSPNLQNIPLRSDQGRAIRHAFYAPEGRILLSLDYSQIELRLLAYMGPVPALKEAFMADKDIHEEMARLLFKIPPEGHVSSDQRRIAKTINFGVLYGMSAFGLHQQLSISVQEAQDFIDAYFAHLPGIQDYFQRCIDQAYQQGYVMTLWGRRCPILGARHPKTAKAAQRQAINAPLQGTCADSVKKAMLVCSQYLEDVYPQGVLLLQVHDELVFEMPQDVPGDVVKHLCVLMENVMDIPLKVNASFGSNWAELEPWVF